MFGILNGVGCLFKERTNVVTVKMRSVDRGGRLIRRPGRWVLCGVVI